MTVKGAKAHSARLKSMTRIKAESQRKLLEAGQIVEDDARQSMNAGAISGPGHVPSLPGQPAKSDTHVSERSIRTKLNPSGKSVSVVGGGAFMFFEFGTSRMVERPVLRPALRRNRNRIVYGQVKAVQDTVRVLKGS